MARNLRLKAARAERDLSQKALAEAVGVSRQTVNAIEQGTYNPTLQLCVRICRVLGKTLNELFWEEPEADRMRGIVMYCEACNVIYTGDRCPSCGSTRGRPPQPEDICFLMEKDAMWGRMLEDVLRQNGMEVWTKSTLGVGLALKVGGMFERLRIYVRYARWQEAQDLAAQLFSGEGDSTEPEAQGTEP